MRVIATGDKKHVYDAPEMDDNAINEGSATFNEEVIGRHSGLLRTTGSGVESRKWRELGKLF